MSSEAFALLYINGNIVRGVDGDMFNCPEPVMAVLPLDIGLQELKKILHQELDLQSNQEVGIIKFRCPVAAGKTMKYKAMVIKHDRHVQCMFQVYSRCSELCVIELYVETRYQEIECEVDRVQSQVEVDAIVQDNLLTSECDIRDNSQYASPKRFGAKQLVDINVPNCMQSTITRNIEPNVVDLASSLNKNCHSGGLNIDGDNNSSDSWQSKGQSVREDEYNPEWYSEDGLDDDDILDDNNVETPDLQGVTSAMRTNVVPIPILHTPHCTEINWAVIDAPEHPPDLLRSNWDARDELCVGLRFKSKEAVILALRHYHLHRHQDFVVDESKSRYFTAHCPHNKDGCQWRIRVSHSKDNNMWVVKRFIGPHTCVASSISQHHRQLTSAIIASYIEGIISFNPGENVAKIIAEIKMKFQYTVSYKKAWLGKQKAIRKLYGSWDNSYKLLPRWMAAMVASNPGSVYEFVHVEANNRFVDDRHIVFGRVFWSFKPCIEGFRHCKPVLGIDGIHLYGKYCGTLLIATGQDGDDRIFPVAFAVVENENTNSWIWFLACLRKFVTQRQGICLISDRHVAIEAAVRNEHMGWLPPKAYCCYCLHHLQSDFHKEFNNKVLKKLIYKAGVQYQQQKYTKVMEEIRKYDEHAANWCEKIPKEQWTLAFDDHGRRWGHMTTNLSGCINGILKGVRELPITALVHQTLLRCVTHWNDCGKKALAMQRDNLMFSDSITTKMADNARKAGAHMVMEYNKEREMFEVLTGPNHITGGGGKRYTVNLAERICSCGKFQHLKFPCSHVMAACAHIAISPNQFVDKMYLLENVLNTYSYTFYPMGHEDYWPVVGGPMLIPNPELIRPKGSTSYCSWSSGDQMHDKNSPKKSKDITKRGVSRKRKPKTS